MTEETLAEIRDYVRMTADTGHVTDLKVEVRLYGYITALLADVDQLREIAQAVADERARHICDNYFGVRCGFCDVFIAPAEKEDTRPIQRHKQKCLVRKARAALGTG